MYVMFTENFAHVALIGAEITGGVCTNSPRGGVKIFNPGMEGGSNDIFGEKEWQIRIQHAKLHYNPPEY